jgi:hypothetical protein
MKGREMDVRRGIVTEEREKLVWVRPGPFFGFCRHEVPGTWRYRVTWGGERGERALLLLLGAGESSVVRPGGLVWN